MSEWLELTVGSFRWRVAADWRDTLFDDDGLRLKEWRNTGVLQTLKEAPHRTLYRVNLPAGVVYLKHYPLPDLRSRLRQLVRPSKGRAEFNKVIEVAKRGVPTIEPLASGESREGESFLVTRGLIAAEPLNQFIERTLPGLPVQHQIELRFQLAEEMARLLGRMHTAGVLHRDLHAGNILVTASSYPGLLAGASGWYGVTNPKRQRGDGGRGERLFLIDLHAVRLQGPLDWGQGRDNLVMLNRWFVQRSSRADRRRFWRAYVRERFAAAWSSERVRQEARVLEELTWQSCLKFWRKRDRRWLTNNRYAFFRQENGSHGWAVRDLPAGEFTRLLADPEAPLARPRSKQLKSSRSSKVVALAVETKAGETDAIYKRFSVTKWTDSWLAVMRGTPAYKSWLNGHRLLECGLPTARPLAMIQCRRHGLVHESYLLTENLSGALPLDQHLAHLEALIPAARRRHSLPLIERLARLVRDLHLRNFSHRDLKATNVLVSAGGPSSLFLIDLVGLTRWRVLPRERKVQNLARLNASASRFAWISRADKLRFLRTYLAWGLQGKTGWKDWWRQIARKTQEKVAQNRRRGRPLS
jgi:tRNA A-37 threonylcarbamoyl transferase component Bud32